MSQPKPGIWLPTLPPLPAMPSIDPSSVMVFNRPLSDAERDAMTAEMMKKWGVAPEPVKVTIPITPEHGARIVARLGELLDELERSQA